MESVESVNFEEKQKNKSGKNKLVISIICIAALAIAALLYFILYKRPYDKAVAEFNAVLETYNSEVSALDAKNEELDSSINALKQIINAENLPIDDLLLSEAQSVLTEAQNYPKDLAPEVPKLSGKIDEVIAATSELSTMVKEVQAMGDYSNILPKVKDTETKYRSMIDNFKGPEAEIVWTGVDEEWMVLRFVAKFSNPNDYTLKGVNTEWVAYDANEAVVGSFKGLQPDIPAHGYIYYVGGAGSANLSGTPANAEIKVTADGQLTNRVAPQITVENVQVINNGYNYYTVSADCETDSDVKTVDLDGNIIVKDANGEIIGSDFWGGDNLPDTLEAGDKFKLSVDFFHLPAIPQDAEVYINYKWQ